MEDYYDAVAGNAEAGQNSYMQAKAPVLEISFRNVSAALTRLIRQSQPPGSLVLDVGCGHGAMLETLATDYQLFGVDLSANNLRLAKKRGFEVYQSDLMHLPFQDNQFDVVVSSGVMQHVTDHTRALAEMTRVCRSKGTVLVATLNATSILRKIFPLVRVAFNVKQPMKLFARRPAEFALPANLDPTGVAFVLTPTPFVVMAGNASPIAPLATTFITRFTKR